MSSVHARRRTSFFAGLAGGFAGDGFEAARAPLAAARTRPRARADRELRDESDEREFEADREERPRAA
jgi:hypothetical protein